METIPHIAAAPRNDAAGATGSAAVYGGICQGTLGELVQGPYVQDGEIHICLISLPLKKYSSVLFRPGADKATDGLANKAKCRRAIELYLARHRLTLPAGSWTCDSELLVGKGMASSTADIVATIRCLDAIFARRSSADAIAALLRGIERSDSVFLNTYALYLSGQQAVVQRFASSPAFHACYIDEGDKVDTEGAGNRLLAHYARHLGPYGANIAAATNAFVRGDPRAIAACATRSAVLGQEALPKRNLDVLLRHQDRFGADGIFVAHTGSLIGYLFTEEPEPERMGELSSFFHGLGHPCRFVLTGV